MSDKIDISWGSGDDMLSIEPSVGKGNGTIMVSSMENLTMYDREVSLLVRNKEFGLRGTVAVKQERPFLAYVPAVTWEGSEEVSAGGGTVTPVITITATKKGTTTVVGEEVLTPTSMSTTAPWVTKEGSSFVFSSRGTTAGDSRTALVSYNGVLSNGDSVEGSFTIIQAANVRSVQSVSGGVYTYGEVVAGAITNKTIAASGGEATATAGNGSQSWSRTEEVTTYVYTSGATATAVTQTTGSGTNSITPSVGSLAKSAASKGTTVSGVTTVGSQAVTWSGQGNKSATGTLYVYQAANVKTQTGVTISSSQQSGWYSGSWAAVPASGGVSLYVYGVSNFSFTSGSTATEVITENVDAVVSADGGWATSYAEANGATNKRHVTISSRGTEIGPARSGSVKWVVGDFTSNSLSFTQVMNKIDSLTVNPQFSYEVVVAAGGGSVSPTLNGHATYTFTSGSTATGDGTGPFFGGKASFSRSYSMPETVGWALAASGALTATNNTSTSTRTSGTVSSTLSCTYTNPASVGSVAVTNSATGTATATQSAGYYTYSEVTASMSYAATAAAGGTTSPVISFSQTYGWNGATSGAGTISTYTKGAFSMTATAGATLNTTTGAVTWTNNTSTTARTSASVSVRITGSGGKYKDISATSSQNAGSYSYAAWTVSASANPATVGAGGGTSTITGAASRTYGWNGATSGAGTQTGTVTYSIPTTTGASLSSNVLTWANRTTTVGDARSVVVTVTCQEDKTKTATVTVTQSANATTTITYGDITGSFSYSSVGAGGGTSTPTVTYSQSRTQNYTSGSTSALSAVTTGATLTYAKTSGGGTLSSTSTGAVSVASRGTTVDSGNTTAYTGTVKIELNGKSTTLAATVSQTKNEATTITYGTPTVSLSYGTIGAGGGTVNPTLSYSQSRTQNYTSGSTSALSAVTTGGSVSYSRTSGSATVNATSGAVTAASRGTTLDSANTTAAVVSVTVTLNSKSGSGSATVSQTRNQATTITYGTPSVTVTAGDVPASGGSVTSGTATYSQTRTQNYTSGSTSALSAVTTGGSVAWSGGASNIASLGTTVKARTAVGSALTATVTLNSKSGSGSVTVYQAANSLTWNTPVLTYTYADVAAGGSTVTPTVSITQSGSYTSGSSASNTTIGSKTFSGTGVNTSSGAYTGSSLGTTVKTRTKLSTGTVTVTANSKSVSGSADIYQAANSLTWNVPVVTMSYGDIAAGGGSVTPTVSITQSGSYTSGSSASNTTIGSKTFSGTSVNTSTGAVSGSSLGTTVKARTKITTSTVSVTANSKTGTKAVDVYQAANAVTNANYNPRITAYGTPTVSIGTGITAAGGSATVTSSVNNTQTYNALYTSGSQGPDQTRSVAGSVTLSLTGNGNSRFSLSGTTLSHSNMTTNVATDTATVTGTNAGDSTKKGTGSVSVENKQTVTGTTGGAYTYYDVTAGTITNATIGASGGTGTATAGNGSQRVTRTAIVTSYSYTSGSTNSATTTAASDVTNSIAPSVASKQGTAASKGTTVSGVTTVGSQAVTWSGQGNKSATGTLYVYQAANNATYGDLTGGSVTAADIPAGGATRTATVTNMAQTVSYTSGSTRAGTVNNSQTAAVVGSSLGTTVKARTKLGTITVTFTGEGSKTATKSVDVYQALNKVTSISAVTAAFSYTNIAAGGGSVSPSLNGNATLAFSSGSTAVVSSGGSVYSGTMAFSRGAYSMAATTGWTLNTTSGALTATNNTSTSTRTSGTVSNTITATFTNGSTVGGDTVSKTDTKTATATQNAGSYSYGAWTIALSANTTAIGAGGGSATLTSSASRTYGWNGATSGAGTQNGTIKLSIPTTTGATLSGTASGSTLTWASLGTTISNARSVVVTSTCQEDTSKTATVTITQSGNYVASLTASSGGSFSYAGTHGGSVTPTASNRTLTYTFSSGSTSTTTPATTYGSLTTGAASYTWSGASAPFTALAGTTGVMTVSSAGAAAANAATSPTVTRTMTYTWTPVASYNSAGTKTVSPTQTATCTRLANSITWGNPVVTMSYGDIAAGGSTVTPTVSITQSGTWSNGSTSSNTTIDSKTFSGTGVNTSTGAYTGSSLGTTVKARTKLSTGTVTVTAKSKSGTGSADIYQAANAIASYKDWRDTFTINPMIVSAAGDKVYFSGSSKGTAVYTSGSSGTAGAITSNLTGVTSNATWATVNFADGSISVAANSGDTGRNTTLTATYANGRTKTTVLTQEANIGAMYVVFHNNTAQTLNWEVSFTLTLNGNYVSAYGSSAYETTAYGQQSESLNPVGEINPASAGMTSCSQMKLTDVAVGAFRTNGSMYSSQFRAWVTVEKHNASNGGDLQLATCGSNSSPMITNGTTNTSPTSSSSINCSPTFYTAEANRYLIHIAIG